ncbi:MAG: type IX secretion system sortase PorU [Bacteroidaceae bacterium]|nr:type IX secretion system sortase PorU [Bacteroidaceae bacterium]
MFRGSKLFTVRYPLFVILLLSSLNAKAEDHVVWQQFFNLTPSELRIDSVLPLFKHSLPLQGSYEDSVYSIKIVYPECVEIKDKERDICKQEHDKHLVFGTEDIEFIPRKAGFKLIQGLEQSIVVERKKARLEIVFSPIVYSRKTFSKMNSFMLRVTSKAKTKRTAARTGSRAQADSTSIYAASSVLSGGKWAKIYISETGITELPQAVVKEAGFSNLEKVKVYGYGGHLQNEQILKSELRELDDLREIPTTYTDGRLFFYGKATVSFTDKDSEQGTSTLPKRIRNNYSEYGYYFITEDGEAPQHIDKDAFIAKYYPQNNDYHVLHEVDNYAWFHGGRNLYEDTPIETGSSKTYTIPLTAFPKGTNFAASINVSAGSSSTFTVTCNGQKSGVRTVSLGNYDVGSSSLYTTNLTGDSAIITIEAVSGGPLRLDYIDIFSLDNPKNLPSFTSQDIPKAKFAGKVSNQNLHADAGYHMVIIIPTSGKLLAQAERLKAFHETNDNMKVKVVTADKLFNEFSSGTPDANAYRRYMKMLYDRATTEADMPRHLLLFGNGSFDNRMLSPSWIKINPDDYLLCYEGENSFSKTSSVVNDGFFCLLDEGEGIKQTTSDKEDIAIGRLPANTPEEAEIMVSKIISYAENKNAGKWQSKVVCIGDDGDKNIHMKHADDVAIEVERLAPAMIVKKVMIDAYKRESSATGNTYPDATKDVKAQINDGALIFNYSGHGAPTQMAHENLIQANDFSSATNRNLPLWFAAACDITPYDRGVTHFGNSALLNPNGGAIAFYSSAREVFPAQNKAINLAFIKAIFTPVKGEYVSIGEAQRIAKNNLITGGATQDRDLSENKLQYSLMGDPALKLNIPTQEVIIDSINGKSITDEADIIQLKAASIATIKGHIQTTTQPSGRTATASEASASDTDYTFNGTVNLTMRDAEQQIVCRLNDPSAADDPFTFYDRPTNIYNGSTYIKNGEFTITFAVPKDIDYSQKTGKINCLAVSDNNNTAIGYTEKFYASETEETPNDSIGPSIYCYLNSPAFINGGNVNPTPLFYAEITDKDGINASGSGIGHDMRLTIDNDPKLTYSLNDNFTFDMGSYQKGSTHFTIPQLPEGKHKLTFKAWDILNNPNTTSLTFNVVSSLAPQLQDIACTNNPARESTTFIITHDRMGSDLNAEVEVMTVTGILLWKTTVNTTAADSNALVVNWDLTTSTGGKLQTGVYLYRVKLISGNISSTSKAKKLIVIQ